MPPAQHAPLVVLVHGLGGSEDSAYMTASAWHDRCLARFLEAV